MSSTIRDLRDVRAHVVSELNNMGHQVVNSEDDGFFANPSLEAVQACLAEVETSDILVLIVDRAFGSRYGPDRKKSVTQAELDRARGKNIPVFTLVRKTTQYALEVYKANPGVNIQFPGIDEDQIEVLRFLDSIMKQDLNNWVHAFDTSHDAVSWLQAQLSALLKDCLARVGASRDISTAQSSPGISDYLAGEKPFPGPAVVSAQTSPQMTTSNLVHREGTSSVVQAGTKPAGQQEEKDASPLDVESVLKQLQFLVGSYTMLGGEDQKRAIHLLGVYIMSWTAPTEQLLHLLRQVSVSMFAALDDPTRRRAAKRLVELFNETRGYTTRGWIAQTLLRLVNELPEQSLEAAVRTVIGSLADNEFATQMALEDRMRTLGPKPIREVCLALLNSSRVGDATRYFRKACDNPHIAVVREEVEAYLNEHDPE